MILSHQYSTSFKSSSTPLLVNMKAIASGKASLPRAAPTDKVVLLLVAAGVGSAITQYGPDGKAPLNERYDSRELICYYIHDWCRNSPYNYRCDESGALLHDIYISACHQYCRCEPRNSLAVANVAAKAEL
ncbi:hypothetical protein B0T10DRAFT_544109 [Thelonectria olida]|uniref:Uncharacterized protein n=1 Tax=Thelonectria olida TaxID=1576542 RepID=A0A9P8WCV3_9HYPO|nr:hypothetical protein B0T10DRAFT_544109 [Thelonectria olida]